MRVRRLLLFVLSGLVFLPATLWAQAGTGAIAGVVKDTSGAVLPGVTVEAASPALIEKVRSAVTDEAGAYRIVELRPGTYTVTFSLTGFSTVKREGIELTSSFTATVSPELKVGGLEETITVSGETPVVDISSARQQTTVSRAVLDAIPTTKRMGQYASFIPGAVYSNPTFQDSGGTAGEGGQFAVHGQRVGDQMVNLEGLNQNLFGLDVYSFNSQTIQEVVVETSGQSAEAMTGGVQVNIINKDGGNKWSGSFATSFARPSMQSDNLTDELRKRGVTSGASLRNFRDNGGSFGGPIKKDNLWFYTAHRYWGSSKYIQGNYYNGSPNPLLYVPDLSRPAFTDWYYHDNNLRLTWQATPKDKVVAFYSQEDSCNCPVGLSGTISSGLAIRGTPDSRTRHIFNPLQVQLVSWNRPQTNKLLLEGAFSRQVLDEHSERMPGVPDSQIAVRDVGLGLEYGNLAGAGNPAGNNFFGSVQRRFVRSYTGRLAASYVTGSHTFKAGLQIKRYNLGREGANTNPDAIWGGLSYVFRNQVPLQVQLWAVPFELLEYTTNTGIYAQDQWAVKHVTLNLGVRYDGLMGATPPFTLPAGYFVPVRTFAATQDLPNYKNINPRLSVTYDVFGDGKTAIKGAFGRYVPYLLSTLGNPQSNQSASTTVNWNDANGNFFPDCDLKNPAANGECGARSDQSFGTLRPGLAFSSNALTGFNAEQYNWQSSVSVQQQLLPGVALNVGYFRTWYGNFLVTDNLATTAADYNPFCVTLPATSGSATATFDVPGGGQQRCGFFDIKPSLFGVTNNLRTQASDYGNMTEHYNGVDITMTARTTKGVQFSGGVSIGRQTLDACEVAAKVPESLNGQNGLTNGINNGPGLLTTGSGGSWSSMQDCKVTPPWSAGTQAKFLFVYPLPYDLQFSLVYQNFAGIPIPGNWAITNGIVSPSLGRNIAACGANCTAASSYGTIEAVSPGVLYEPRQNQVDLRFARRFAIRGTNLRTSVDLSNILNGANVYSINTGVGALWRVANEIQGGRLARINIQFEF